MPFASNSPVSLSMREKIRDLPLRVQKYEEVEIIPVVPFAVRLKGELSPC